MTKLVQNDIASLTNEQSALAALNANYALNEVFSDSVLSRDGTSPNQMEADLDMNSNQILNIGDPLDMNGARIIGLDDGVDPDEPATVNQLNNAILSGGGATANADYVVLTNNALLNNERSLAVGAGVSLTDGGANSTITIGLDADLQAAAALSSTGLVTRTAANTWTTRTLTAPAAGITITNPAGIAGDPTLVLANDLAALEAMSGTGIAVHTGVSTWTERSLVAPAAGITITNNTGVAGNPTLVLANDLAAVEGLSTNGMMARTATDTMTTRTITQPAAGITVSNGDGVAGNPTLALANDLSAVEGLSTTGLVTRTASDTMTTRSILNTANETAVTNGDGVSGNITIGLASALTFTGKTITGGTYSGPTITGTEDVQQNIQWSGDISPASFGTQQDNYSPAGLATASTLRLTASAPADVTGLAGGADGRILILHNIGASTITLKDESASSTAANRFALTLDLAVLTDMMVFLQYDSTSQRWRCVSGGGGGGGGGAATSEPFVTIGNSGTLSAERALTAGSGISITDGGANSTVTVAASSTRRTISGADTVVAADNGNIIEITSGTFTLAFTAAATLGNGFSTYIVNSGTGDVTLDPNGAEQIDGLTSWILYPGGRIIVACTSTAFESVLLGPMQKTFDANGTFTKPGSGTYARLEGWGAGGSGGKGSANVGAGGGGGGAHISRDVLLSVLGTTETITVGTGGALVSAATTVGNVGNNTTIGSLVTAFGGGGGCTSASGAGGGGGGGHQSTAVAPANQTAGTRGGQPATTGTATMGSGGGGSGAGGGPNAQGGGGGGGGGTATGGAGGAASDGGGGGGAGGSSVAPQTGAVGGGSTYGGGGGGGGGQTTAGAGGDSLYGGDGGAGATGANNATQGSQPGGGGGGSVTGNSGAGADGRVVITVY